MADGWQGCGRSWPPIIQQPHRSSFTEMTLNDEGSATLCYTFPSPVAIESMADGSISYCTTATCYLLHVHLSPQQLQTLSGTLRTFQAKLQISERFFAYTDQHFRAKRTNSLSITSICGESPRWNLSVYRYTPRFAERNVSTNAQMHATTQVRKVRKYRVVMQCACKIAVV